MHLLWYLTLDVTTNCIREIHCFALDGFNLNTVYKLSSKEKKISAEPGFEPEAAGWEERMLPLCYADLSLQQGTFIQVALPTELPRPHVPKVGLPLFLALSLSVTAPPLAKKSA